MADVGELSGDDDFCNDVNSQRNVDLGTADGIELNCDEEVFYIEFTNSINYTAQYDTIVIR